MKRLVKKYLQSVLSPDEFDQFCDYISRSENTFPISGAMKSEWLNFLADDDLKRENPLLFNKLQKTILSEENAETKKRLKFYAVTLRIAAVLLIGALVTSVWFYQQSRSTFEKTTNQTVSIPIGAKTELTMPDGSKVWLNSGSKITYSSDFSKERNVLLVGEAFFDVVKGKIPFEVNTSYGTVHVMGTAFDVQAYPDGNFVTTLERGVVKVTDKDNNRQEVIAPGEQVRLVRDNFIKKEVNTELYTSWKDGKLIFSRDPFPDMMKRLERWFNVKIVYSANDFKGLWFSGTIEDETLTEVMEMVCKSAPMSYSYNTHQRKIIITAKKN
ncbi:FecR family protein [Sunxiuqinia indica]|uniref:FecR family protein n=1 Tax=Sunxiuqinia indica TaxID=2692584 RepID=UPI00135BE4BD|nr:FecR family protein [Sunxiuqinia indica]